MDGERLCTVSRVQCGPVQGVFRTLVWKYAQGAARWGVCNPVTHNSEQLPQFLHTRSTRRVGRVSHLQTVAGNRRLARWIPHVTLTGTPLSCFERRATILHTTFE